MAFFSFREYSSRSWASSLACASWLIASSRARDRAHEISTSYPSRAGQRCLSKLDRVGPRTWVPCAQAQEKTRCRVRWKGRTNCRKSQAPRCIMHVAVPARVAVAHAWLCVKLTAEDVHQEIAEMDEVMDEALKAKLDSTSPQDLQENIKAGFLQKRSEWKVRSTPCRLRVTSLKETCTVAETMEAALPRAQGQLHGWLFFVFLPSSARETKRHRKNQ